MTIADPTLDQIATELAAGADVIAQLLPTPSPLAVGEVASGDDLSVPGPGQSLVVTVGDSAMLAFVLSPVLTTALQNGPLGPQSLDAVLEPVVAEAARAMPTLAGAVGPAQLLDTELVVEQATDAAVVVGATLLDGAELAAALVLVMHEVAEAAAPEPVASAAPAPANAAPTPPPVAEPAAFEPLTSNGRGVAMGHGLELLHDVEMGVTAELGRTRMAVRDLLALAPGSVVELDRLAGGPVDLLVNGTMIARGEVVVIDEEFGVRITEIVSDQHGRSMR